MKAQTALRKYREEKMMLTDMAKLLGIGQSRYFYIESGERPVSPELAEKISLILHVPQERLFLPSNFMARDVSAKKTK